MEGGQGHRAAGRRTRDHQGELCRQGLRVSPGHRLPLPRLALYLRRRARWPPPRCWRPDCRDHEHARARLGHQRDQPLLWPRAEPVQPRPDVGRVERRERRERGGGDRPREPRGRRGRLGPDPVGVLRARGAQADLRPAHARSRRRPALDGDQGHPLGDRRRPRPHVPGRRGQVGHGPAHRAAAPSPRVRPAPPSHGPQDWCPDQPLGGSEAPRHGSHLPPRGRRPRPARPHGHRVPVPRASPDQARAVRLCRLRDGHVGGQPPDPRRERRQDPVGAPIPAAPLRAPRLHPHVHGGGLPPGASDAAPRDGPRGGRLCRVRRDRDAGDGQRRVPDPRGRRGARGQHAVVDGGGAVLHRVLQLPRAPGGGRSGGVPRRGARSDGGGDACCVADRGQVVGRGRADGGRGRAREGAAGTEEARGELLGRARVTNPGKRHRDRRNPMAMKRSEPCFVVPVFRRARSVRAAARVLRRCADRDRSSSPSPAAPAASGPLRPAPIAMSDYSDSQDGALASVVSQINVFDSHLDTLSRHAVPEALTMPLSLPSDLRGALEGELPANDPNNVSFNTVRRQLSEIQASIASLDVPISEFTLFDRWNSLMERSTDLLDKLNSRVEHEYEISRGNPRPPLHPDAQPAKAPDGRNIYRVFSDPPNASPVLVPDVVAEHRGTPFGRVGSGGDLGSPVPASPAGQQRAQGSLLPSPAVPPQWPNRYSNIPQPEIPRPPAANRLSDVPKPEVQRPASPPPPAAPAAGRPATGNVAAKRNAIFGGNNAGPDKPAPAGGHKLFGGLGNIFGHRKVDDRKSDEAVPPQSPVVGAAGPVPAPIPMPLQQGPPAGLPFSPIDGPPAPIPAPRVHPPVFRPPQQFIPPPAAAPANLRPRPDDAPAAQAAALPPKPAYPPPAPPVRRPVVVPPASPPVMLISPDPPQPDRHGSPAGAGGSPATPPTPATGGSGPRSEEPDDLRIEASKVVYDETQKLGAGGFGVVYQGVLFDFNEVAVKVIKGNVDERTRADFKKEVRIWQKLRHKHGGAAAHGLLRGPSHDDLGARPGGQPPHVPLQAQLGPQDRREAAQGGRAGDGLPALAPDAGATRRFEGVQHPGGRREGADHGFRHVEAEGPGGADHVGAGVGRDSRFHGARAVHAVTQAAGRRVRLRDGGVRGGEQGPFPVLRGQGQPAHDHEAGPGGGQAAEQARGRERGAVGHHGGLLEGEAGGQAAVPGGVPAAAGAGGQAVNADGEEWTPCPSSRRTDAFGSLRRCPRR